MCTVTYIPKENGDFILTQNRDEDIKRALATPPIERMINGVKHLFPVDPSRWRNLDWCLSNWQDGKFIKRWFRTP